MPVFKANIKLDITKDQIAKNQIGLRKKTLTAIIITQNCDLENEKVNEVILAHVYKLSSILKGFNPKFHSQVKKDLHERYIYRFHLLNQIPKTEFEDDHPVVDFEKIYVTPKHLLNLYSENKKIRVLSPYKEHLFQGFTRFYMRISIPTLIPTPL